MPRDNDRADGCSCKQKSHNLKREHIAADESHADIVNRDGRNRGLMGKVQALWSTAQPKTAKTAAAITSPASQLRLYTPSFGVSEPRVRRIAKTIRMATAPI